MLDVSWQRDPNQPSAWQIQLEISTCFIFKGPRGMTLQLPNNKIRIQSIFFTLDVLLVLNVGNGWEWGLLGLLLIVIVDHSLIPY
jgi:hypothetical protein